MAPEIGRIVVDVFPKHTAALRTGEDGGLPGFDLCLEIVQRHLQYIWFLLFSFHFNPSGNLINHELGQIIRENKFEYCQEIWKQGGEGIILKNINGLYLPDKRPMWNWMKVKQDFDDDVFIVGFMPPTKEYDGNTPLGLWQYWETERGLIVSDPDGAPAIPVTKYYAMGWIGSIIIGQYRPLNASVGIPIPGMQNYSSKGQTWVPVEVGSVSGMRERDRGMFSKDPEKYIGKAIAIKAMERTDTGAYRHPRFIRLRLDKPASQCRLGEGL
jgi:hypothetical protein